MSAPLNARDAKCCCECRHWSQRPHDAIAGECRNPELRVGLTYLNADGSETHVEWQTTGRYATCNLWGAK